MRLYIIRGLPGSGKSTLANEMNCLVCEADNFFIDKEGNYVFDASKLGEAHRYCQASVEAAMQMSASKIAVSNTFSRKWEMMPYYQLALEYGYEVTQITMTGTLYKSIHDVPQGIIQAMIDRWEH